MTTPLLEPIQTPDELAALVRAVQAVPEICLDTEADSLHHYFDKVCLIQITVPRNGSDEGDHFLIDTLAGLDLQPLFAALREKSLVLHGSDYDLRVLRRDFQFIPSVIFDTMHASRMAGHAGLGLDALVEKYLGRRLDHKTQKADWSQRPLPDRLRIYAVEDTRFLPLIARTLRAELSVLGRLEWHRQVCAQLIELSGIPPERDPGEAWRIKGSFHLARRNLAVLRELWQWRDAEAQHWDRPSFMVAGNEKLIELAQWASEHPRGSLRDGPDLPRRWPPRVRRHLESALARAWDLPEADWPPQAPRGKRPPSNPQFVPRLKRLREARDVIAKEFKIDPSLLAPNATLEAIAGLCPKELDELKQIDRWLPWQTDLLGRAFLDALAAQERKNSTTTS